VLFELKYLKKSDVPDPTSETGKKIIAAKSDEAVQQLQIYGSAEEFRKIYLKGGRKMTCFALVFLKDECVERVTVQVG